MEQLNKVELKGVVGNAWTSPIGDTNITRFSVATTYAYKDKGGNNILETTWHQCTSFDPKAAELKRGDSVSVMGRIRNNRYTDSEGSERTSCEILVNKLTINNN